MISRTIVLLFMLGISGLQRSEALEQHHVRSCTITALDVCTSTANLSIPSFFQPGDTVVIHQAASRDFMHVGAFDVNIIDTIIGASAHFKYAIQRTFDTQGIIQLVRAVSVGRIDNTDSVTTIPWNGHYGGVVAIVSIDTLVIDGIVYANGIGFRGGGSSHNSRDTVLSELSTIDNGTLVTFNGYPRNGGGYGGSLLTQGGRGGAPTDAYEHTTSIPWPTQSAIVEHDSTQPRLYLGSGGGSGHQNDLRGGKGGNGGGAILICAPHVITTARAALDASGNDGDDATYDGGGGGGSGGTIIIDTKSLHGGIVCDVSGGVGGSTYGSIFRYGPGGGGAGGVVTVSDRSLISSIRVQRGGGAGGGSHVDTSATIEPYGAQPGSDGTLRAVPLALMSPRTSPPTASVIISDTTIGRTSFLRCGVSAGIVVRWIIDSVPHSAAQTMLLPRDSVHCCIEADVDLGGCISRLVHALPLEPRAGNEIRVSLDRIRGSAGDTVSIFLRVERLTGQSAIQGTAFVRMRQSVLMPLDPAQRSTIINARVAIPFTLASSTRSTFRRFDAVALLGDSAQIQLGIDSVAVTPRATEVLREHGRFSLNDVCTDRGPRLFDQRADGILRGRTISVHGEAGIVTDLRGRVVCRLSQIELNGMLSGTIPDDYNGICYIVVTRGLHIQTYVVMVEP